MKNMSPLPINLQMDHSSSTESAHDQAEKERKDGNSKRRPSKIPLKSYTAPKPPGGKWKIVNCGGECFGQNVFKASTDVCSVCKKLL